MESVQSCVTYNHARRVQAGLMQAFVLAMLVTLSVPAKASEERAVLQRVAPTYPVLAARMKITGSVNVQATVDPGGKVVDVKATSGNSILMPAAENAVRSWQFESGKGTVKVDVTVTFRE